MRPLIVIGATTAMREALEPYAQVGHIEHHPTAEDAHWALLESGASADTLEGRGWDVHVAYGPEAYGSLIVGHNAGTHRLQHSGRTFVFCWDVDPDPGRPRRVMGGQVVEPHPDTTPWQVSAAISADYVVDLAREVGVPFLVRLLEWKDGAHT
jgi:hypothetical protein